eukprot:jgi/Galph1/1204/GphlegSOOS_G6066.1
MNGQIITLLQQEKALLHERGNNELAGCLEKAIKQIEDMTEPLDSISKVRSLSTIGPIQAAKIERLIANGGEFVRRNVTELSQNNEKKLKQDTIKLKSIKKTRRPIGKKDTIPQESCPLNNNEIMSKRKYVPKYRSAAYALLIGLYESQTKYNLEAVDKQQLIRLSQPFCDSILQRTIQHFCLQSNFISSQSYSEQISGWTCMKKSLLKRRLVKVTSERPARYFLTSVGLELASQLYKRSNSNIPEMQLNKSSNDYALEFRDISSIYDKVQEWGSFTSVDSYLVSKSNTNHILCQSSQGAVSGDVAFKFPQVCVILDNREAKGSGKCRKDLLNYLHMMNIPVRLRQLELGDISFIAEENNVGFPTNDSSKITKGKVLDYLIERKRSDDLASSLHDRRFSRQRFLMKETKIKHLIYLVEGSLEAQEKENAETLWQALMNTAIIDGFHIEYSKDVWESARFVANLYRVIQNQMNETSWSQLVDRPCLEDWNRQLRMNKKMKGTDRFKWQLMAIPGIDCQRANSIAAHGIQSLIELGNQLDIFPTTIERIEWLRQITETTGKRKWNGNVYERLERLFCEKNSYH